jgi:glyoxylase-like metal-dependent hydrolase (beta-lactamase superfamily II)
LVHRKLLIDTDWAGSFNKFLKCIRGKNVSMQEIQYLLVTHYHPDHMGIAAELMERGTKLLVMDVQKDFVHQADPVFAKDRRNPFKPIPEEQAVILKCAESRRFLNSIGIEGEIIATPGHSEDSISLILDEEKMAFVGDIPPLEQIECYQNAVLGESAASILQHEVRILYHSHWPDEWIR